MTAIKRLWDDADDDEGFSVVVISQSRRFDVLPTQRKRNYEISATLGQLWTTEKPWTAIQVRGKYRDIILPMVVLRRLDALLEPTRTAIFVRDRPCIYKGLRSMTRPTPSVNR